MRTHFCGELSKANLNDEVKLCGWVNRRRDHGGVIFLDVRDKKGISQVVINPETAETFKVAETIRNGLYSKLPEKFLLETQRWSITKFQLVKLRFLLSILRF